MYMTFYWRICVAVPGGSFSPGRPGPPIPPGPHSGSSDMGQYISEYLQSKLCIYLLWFIKCNNQMKQRAKFETKLFWCTGGDIRQYLAGPPGPPGPPGSPGPAGDGLVDSVANRVIAYIQSMTYYLQHNSATSVTTLDAHMRINCSLFNCGESPLITFAHSGSGGGHDWTPGPPGPPGPPGSISVNDIINLLQRKPCLRVVNIPKSLTVAETSCFNGTHTHSDAMHITKLFLHHFVQLVTSRPAVFVDEL